MNTLNTKKYTNEKLRSLKIREAHEAMLKGEFSACDLAGAYLELIQKENPEIHAYLEVYTDVIEQAKVADLIFKEGKATLMTGIPVGVKDNILVNGHIASSGSKMLQNYVAPYDATAIARLRAQGAVFLGRTNMDEFAMGGSTEKSAYGPTKNPHDTSRVPGGTSGGSAAAVSMSAAAVALGSDTGGSVRQPASFCGVVGLKPTYGAVSRFGLMAAVSSFDQIGPIGRNIDDARILFDTIRGKDVNDGTTIDIESGVGSEAKENGAKKVIGVPWHFLGGEGMDPRVYENFKEIVEKLRSIGHEIKEIKLPHISYALPVYYILNFAEVSSNLARYDGVKYGFFKEGKNLAEDYALTRGEGFGREARRRILLGAYVLSSGYYDAYYNKANALRKVITEDFISVWENDDVDLVITPTTPAPAWKLGEKSVASDPMAMYLADIFTVTPSLTGLPALSVPCGTVNVEDKKLPLGVQLVGKHGFDHMLFDIGQEIENFQA